MTTVNVTTSTAAATTSSSSSALSIDMDDFLQILVTQLQNQNPLEPTDVTEFTNQLVGYAQLGQQTSTNETLESLSSSLTSILTTQSAGYVGQKVEYDSAMAPVQDGAASWTYTLDGEAASTALVVTNQDGDVVWSGSGETGDGEHGLSLSLSDLSGVAEGDILTLTSVSTNADDTSASNAVTAFATLDAVLLADGVTSYRAGDAVIDPSAVLAFYGQA
ncbi:flagellar hook capping FlgD N-terminal domain-containing protein [Brevundimonas sp.]|jgi:flagellar basal-body rod modification protein FlgD|uniref:flagellar hook assembly protein FlgD n=1 Tax=Brevundimonas sp. TaxID=1871086 RepID=UPI001836ABDD|nr:flagellar hook capping FlgD N-terminal domain-containing protein [Brevundimonas sp.]MBA4807783.1 flagellar hook assembly protein FlgD [Brevundimonas sp.]